jgi:hypothetical protein
VIAAWIDAGCPIPDEKEGRAITLLSLPGRVDSYPNRHDRWQR